MFHFLTKKPFLRDLIPDGHIDIHSHLLPGIDDGAASFEDSAFLVSGLREIGIGSFITTPHIMQNVWENTPGQITTKLQDTRAGFEKQGQAVQIKAAAEYLLDANFAARYEQEPLLTLKDNYVLVEMSYINPPIQLYDLIFDLQVAGYQPVLAHPERYIFYYHNFAEYEKLKHSGCKFQLNLLSLIGYYGLNVAKTSEKLIRNGMIDFVGSDVHHKNHLAGFSKRMLFKPETNLREAILNNAFFAF